MNLIGRHGELQRLTSAAKGETGAVFIRGDAGVGKTRLLDAALAEAELLGARVLRARFSELDQDLPYSGLRMALLPALADAAGADAVAAALELRLDDAGTAARDGLAAVFESARRLLTALADAAPVVLALDDLHVADLDSLRAVGLFAAHLRDEPVSVIATLRPFGPDCGPEAAALVERLVAEGFATVVDLHEFDRSETRALVHNLLDATPDDALVTAVWDASRGNAFYATEALRALGDTGRVKVAGGRATLTGGPEPITVSARGSLLHRIFRLGTAARRVSRVLTAFQRVPLDRLDLVAELCDLEPAEVDRAFDDLVGANILREVEPGAFEFVHPIVQSTLYDDLGPAERRRIHARISQRLRDERQRGAPVPIADLALQVSAAAEPGDMDAVAVLVEAGRTAVASAPLTAARWFAAARRLLPDDAAMVGDLLTAEARGLFLASRTRDAARVGQEALGHLPPGGDRVRVAVIVVQALTTLGRFDDALAVAADVEATSGPAPRLRALRGVVLTHQCRFDEAEKELNEALETAADPRDRAAALGGLAACAHAQGDLRACLARLDEQSALEAQLGPGARLASLALRSSYLALAGSLTAASDVLREARAVSQQLGGTAFRATLDVNQAVVDWIAGNWDAAVDASRTVAVEPERAGVYAVLARCAELAVATDRGEFARARELADEVTRSPLATSFAGWAAARLDLALGEVAAARAALEAGYDADQRSGRHSSDHLFLATLAAAALAAGDVDDARRWTRTLEEFATRHAVPWAQVLAGRVRSVVDRDGDAAARSLELAEAAGMVVEAARARLVLGTLGRDPERHLADAYEAFRSLGAEPEMRAVASAMREAGLPVPRPVRTHEGPLTDTELELARLVHEGLTNRQIARVLFLSPKTVEVYLSRVFAKTGCANRLELAVAVSEGRLNTASSRSS